MSISISKACKPRSQPKIPHHRTDAHSRCLVQPKPRMPRNRLLVPKKSVQFSALSKLSVFDPYPSDNWYTAKDEVRFKRERALAVATLFREVRSRNQGTIPASGSFWPVGLEQYLSTKGMRVARLNRKIAIKSVLIEQKRQRAVGSHDPHQIATIAAGLSAEDVKGARWRGKLQEMAKLME